MLMRDARRQNVEPGPGATYRTLLYPTGRKHRPRDGEQSEGRLGDEAGAAGRVAVVLVTIGYYRLPWVTIRLPWVTVSY
jgi:hypothetical protein